MVRVRDDKLINAWYSTLIVGLREIGTSESTIDEITDDPTAIRNVVGIDAAQVIRIYCNGIRNIFILFTAASGEW